MDFGVRRVRPRLSAELLELTERFQSQVATGICWRQRSWWPSAIARPALWEQAHAAPVLFMVLASAARALIRAEA